MVTAKWIGQRSTNATPLQNFCFLLPKFQNLITLFELVQDQTNTEAGSLVAACGYAFGITFSTVYFLFLLLGC